MGLFDWLKSLLGMNESRTETRDDDSVGVPVSDREDTASDSTESVVSETETVGATASMTDEADEEVGMAEPAGAVGSADTATQQSEPEPIQEAESSSVAAGTDATAATETMTDETDEEVGAAEPAEAAGPTAEETGNPLTVIKGIGPAYADRLEAAGIGSIADLAAADATEIGNEIDVSPKRVGRWIERAKHRV